MANQPAHDPFDLTAQQAAKDKAEEKAKARASRDTEDLKFLMSKKQGRRFIFATLEDAGVWRLSFHTNALQMSFNEGQRNGGLALLARIHEHCPEFYPLMLKEQKDDE